MFRHGDIFVHRDAGIDAPEDLVGKTVGVAGVPAECVCRDPGHPSRAPRGSARLGPLRDGGQDTPGRIEKAALDLPSDIQVTRIGPYQTLAQPLADGNTDAVYLPRIPSPFTEVDPRVRRLFPDVVEVESAYFQATGIVPTTPLVAIRCEVYENNRWIAQSLLEAFPEAKELAYRRFNNSSALSYTLLWMTL